MRTKTRWPMPGSRLEGKLTKKAQKNFVGDGAVLYLDHGGSYVTAASVNMIQLLTQTSYGRNCVSQEFICLSPNPQNLKHMTLFGSGIFIEVRKGKMRSLVGTSTIAPVSLYKGGL